MFHSTKKSCCPVIILVRKLGLNWRYMCRITFIRNLRSKRCFKCYWQITIYIYLVCRHTELLWFQVFLFLNKIWVSSRSLGPSSRLVTSGKERIPLGTRVRHNNFAIKTAISGSADQVLAISLVQSVYSLFSARPWKEARGRESPGTWLAITWAVCWVSRLFNVHGTLIDML